MADIIPFPKKPMSARYDPRDIQVLEGLEPVRKRSAVTLLGECAIPDEAMRKFTELLEQYVGVRAIKILDQYGAVTTMWSGDCPRKFE